MDGEGGEGRVRQKISINKKKELRAKMAEFHQKLSKMKKQGK